ncbi:MAG: NUDIX hydrolase [Lachnospiraceae bacterium]|nr:NUDIX hydrolase [Lachnospiraceae bacterium]
MAYKVSETEKEFLKNYKIEDFERPSLATDIAVFSVMPVGERLSIRNSIPYSLEILLVNRNGYPYKGWWALPGGFCIPGESVYDTARRELKEETGVEDAYLEVSDVYGDLKRDPRGWIVSSTFMALINGEKYRLHAGTDAWEAKWFTISIDEEIKEKSDNSIRLEYQMKLKSDDVLLSAQITEQRTFSGCHENSTYEISKVDGIGFDHAKIILQTVLKLRKKAEKDVTILFDLLPEQFTVLHAQNVYESLLNRSVIGPNFRRKISEYIKETDIIVEGDGFRPAKKYERNIPAIMGRE